MDASDVSLVLPAKPENVAVARHALGGAVEALGAADGVSDDVKLAVTEACSNVVRHAYEDRAGDLEIELSVEGRDLLVSVGDRGSGIQPTVGDSDGLGIGLPLIATLSGSVELRTDAETGTSVLMRFPLDVARPRDPGPEDG